MLEVDQPIPRCNCGLAGDVESVASLTGIEHNLLPYWLTRFPDHELRRVEPSAAGAKLVRGSASGATRWPGGSSASRPWRSAGCSRSPPTSPTRDAYFVGGGVLETAPHFRDWFVDEISRYTQLRTEQQRASELVIVPGLDSAGARGSAIAALESLRPGNA